MTTREIINTVLASHSCLTAKEIQSFAYHNLNETVSPSSISGALRSMIREGKAAASKNCKNQSVYWLNN